MKFIETLKFNPRWLFLIILLGSIVHFHNAGDKVAGDGFSYFLYARNLFQHGDLNYHQEDDWIKNHRFKQETSSGVIRNPFSIGPAIMWLPFYSIAHGIKLIETIWTKKKISGFERIYREFIGIGTIVYVSMALWLLFILMIRQGLSPPFAAIVILLGYLTTFLFNYTVFESSMAHGLSFFTISLFLFCWFKFQDDLNWKSYSLLGALIGLAMLMRYTNIIFGVIPVIHLIFNFDIKKFKHFSSYLPSGFIIFFIQMLVWKICFGSFVTIPQGGQFMQWGDPKIMEVLFSHSAGLFASHWLILVGLVGFLLAYKQRYLLVSFLLICIVLLYVNASAYDWYSGHSFGARRFASILPFVFLGLPMILIKIKNALKEYGTGVIIVATCLIIFWNLQFLDLYRRNPELRDRAITPAMVSMHIEKNFGSLLNLPTNFIVSIIYDIKLGQVEQLLGHYPDKVIDPLVDREYLIRGWDKQISYINEMTVRMIKKEQAKLLFPLFRDKYKFMRITCIGQIQEGSMIKWNGKPIYSGSEIVGGSLEIDLNSLSKNKLFNSLEFISMKSCALKKIEFVE